MQLLFKLVFLFIVSPAAVLSLPSLKSGLQSDKLIAKDDSSSLGNAVINTKVLTSVKYMNNIVYVYGALANEMENKPNPKKWTFFYVPVMTPLKDEIDGQEDSWIWATGSNQVRVRLMLGNDELESMVKEAVIKKFTPDESIHAKDWTIMPLMIDSLSAFITTTGNSLVDGVTFFKAVHPNSYDIVMRFQCSSEELAQRVIQKIKRQEYDIEIAFYFAGFKQVTTNMISISLDDLEQVISKTNADGDSKNPQYIHRNQKNKFIGAYTRNVKQMIYLESPDLDVTTNLTQGLQSQFISLFEKAMAKSEKIQLSADLFSQVWSFKDLNPDVIDNELNKLFIYNLTETLNTNDTMLYFDLNKTHLTNSANSNSGSGSGSVSILGLFGGSGGGSSSSSSSNSLFDQLQNQQNSVYSEIEIKKMLEIQNIETSWNGKKIVTKSFQVNKLVEITNSLQVAIISKQMIADKKNGAIIRTVNVDKIANPANGLYQSHLTGTIQMFIGDSPEFPWLMCNGSAVSRKEFGRLFKAIGEKYGAGDGHSTFNLPDFRGRFPIGSNLNYPLGQVGGESSFEISVENLPPHDHDKGSLWTEDSGDHSHGLHDPGHNHGGRTGDYQQQVSPAGKRNPSGGQYGQHLPNAHSHLHSHEIPMGLTGIQVQRAGQHRHEIKGLTGMTGSGSAIHHIQPFISINYIIYSV